MKVAEHALGHNKPKNASREEVLMGPLLAAYWEEHGKSLPSARTTRRNLTQWIDYWGDRTVSELTKNEQTKFRKHLGEGRLKPATIDQVLSSGKAALNHAVDNEVLASFPRIRMIETEEDRRDRDPMAIPISPIQTARLLDAVKNQRLFLFIMIAANTLSRPCAIYDLRRAQFDGSTNIVNLNPAGRRQTKKYRPKVLVTPSLKPWLENEADPQGFYISRNTGRIGSIRASWDKAVLDAGLPKGIAPYSFRHGLSRWIRRSKIPEEQLDQYLGHLPKGASKMTGVYAPMEPEYSADACAAIEAFMAEVRRHVKTANLDDPKALLAENDLGRIANGGLGEARLRKLHDLINAGVGLTEICQRVGVSTTLVYRHRKRLTGRTKV